MCWLGVCSQLKRYKTRKLTQCYFLFTKGILPFGFWLFLNVLQWLQILVPCFPPYIPPPIPNTHLKFSMGRLFWYNEFLPYLKFNLNFARLDLLMNGIIQYKLHWISFLSHNIFVLYSYCFIYQWFVLFYYWLTFHRMNIHNLCIQSPVEIYLKCLQFFYVMNEGITSFMNKGIDKSSCGGHVLNSSWNYA